MPVCSGFGFWKVDDGMGVAALRLLVPERRTQPGRSGSHGGRPVSACDLPQATAALALQPSCWHRMAGPHDSHPRQHAALQGRGCAASHRCRISVAARSPAQRPGASKAERCGGDGALVRECAQRPCPPRSRPGRNASHCTADSLLHPGNGRPVPNLRPRPHHRWRPVP